MLILGSDDDDDRDGDDDEDDDVEDDDGSDAVAAADDDAIFACFHSTMLSGTCLCAVSSTLACRGNGHVSVSI